VHELDMPAPYKRAKGGIKRTIDGTDVDICPFDLYPVGYGVDESLGYETVRYKWKRQHLGWTDLTMRQAYLAEGSREFASSIADQGIVLDHKKQTEDFQRMLRSYMNELRKQKSMTNLYATMGWKDNYKQFVMGDTLHRKMPDGSVTRENISLSSGTAERGTAMYQSKGDLSAWVQATKMLETADMPWHMFALGIGFAAPLFEFTGLKGLTISLFGDSGGGKTLIQHWQQSIYGNPDKLHFTAKFTQNTLFNRLGLYCHLPMTIDEQTGMPDDQVGDFCYWVTQGEDKKRLNRNAEERDARTWATTVTVSTNRSFVSKMTASGMDTDAQLARLLEIPIPVHPLFAETSTAGRKVYGFLAQNHGLVGPIYADLLLEIGEEGLRSMIAEAISTFPQRYGVQFRGVERYIEVGIVLTDLGLRLAHEKGLIAFDYRKGILWILSQLGLIRATNADLHRTPFDILNEYLAEIANEVAVVMHTGDASPALDFTREPRNTIRARFDVYRTVASDDFDHGTIMIVQPPLKKWLAARGVDWSTFKKHFADEGIDATPVSKKFTVGKNTAFKLGQQYVLGLNLCHPELTSHLSDADAAAESLVLGQMQEVSD